MDPETQTPLRLKKRLSQLMLIGFLIVLANVTAKPAQAAFEECGKPGDPGYRTCVNDAQRGGGSNAANLSGGFEDKYSGTCKQALDDKSGIISKDGFISTLCKNSDGSIIDTGQSVFEVIIEKLANVLVFLSVVLFSIMIALAGLQITASGGSPEGIKAGKRRITLAVSSIALIWLARVIFSLLGFTGGEFFGVPVDDAHPFTSETIAPLLENIFKNIQFLAGAAAIVFVIIGGIRFMTSAGNPTAIQAAKKTITYALIGLAVSAGIGLIQATATLIIRGRI